nr:MAG TPA: hypothetical protein [Caudoviricetes sp.]DAR26056.1 MAG TPA: hypothetical protein [Caudoviricetes sp.]
MIIFNHTLYMVQVPRERSIECWVQVLGERT